VWKPNGKKEWLPFTARWIWVGWGAERWRKYLQLVGSRPDLRGGEIFSQWGDSLFILFTRYYLGVIIKRNGTGAAVNIWERREMRAEFSVWLPEVKTRRGFHDTVFILLPLAHVFHLLNHLANLHETSYLNLLWTYSWIMFQPVLV
jgi:hypothetical protein